MEKLKNVYEIQIFSDRSFKVHSSRKSKKFDEDFYLRVRGNVHIINRNPYGVDAIRIIPADEKLVCTVDEDNKNVICRNVNETDD